MYDVLVFQNWSSFLLDTFLLSSSALDGGLEALLLEEPLDPRRCPDVAMSTDATTAEAGVEAAAKGLQLDMTASMVSCCLAMGSRGWSLVEGGQLLI